MLRFTSIVVLCYITFGIVRTDSGHEQENQELEKTENCKCVFYYNCYPNGYIRTSGEGLINFRTQQDDYVPKTCRGGQFEGELKCCKLNSNKNESTIPYINPKPPDLNDTKVNSTKSPGNKPCGIQRTIINVRIFTGEDELTPVAGEFPWLTAIFKKESSGNYKFHCSGSLIYPKVILTVDHYFSGKKAKKFKVILNGNIELPSMNQNVSEERNVVEIVHHPDFYSGNLANDVALLILDKPFTISNDNFVNKICLPPDNVDLDDMRCLVAGWGKGSEEDGKKILKKVEVPFVNHTTCQQLLLKNTNLPPYFELDSSFVCAGGEKGKDACKGDGGSPLMCLNPQKQNFFVAGMVSWGKGCGKENVPGMYASAAFAKEWIQEELAKRHLTD